jgi:hypothetical protein
LALVSFLSYGRPGPYSILIDISDTEPAYDINEEIGCNAFINDFLLVANQQSIVSSMHSVVFP